MKFALLEVQEAACETVENFIPENLKESARLCR